MLLIGFGPFGLHCKPQKLLQTQNNSLLKITVGLRSGHACDVLNTLLNTSHYLQRSSHDQVNSRAFVYPKIEN